MENFNWKDLLALLLALSAFSEMPLLLRVIFLIASVFLLSHSVWKRNEWLKWRYLVICVIVFVFGSIILYIVKPEPPKETKRVQLTWPKPDPIASSTALSSQQLNASASSGGEPVVGTFVYDPALGSTLPPGVDTLRVKFYPNDQVSYQQSELNVTIMVNDDAGGGASAVFHIQSAGIDLKMFEEPGTSGVDIFQQAVVTNTGSSPGELISSTVTLKLRGKKYQSLPMIPPNPLVRVRIGRDAANDGWVVLPATKYWTHAVAENPVQVNLPVIFWTVGRFLNLTVKDVVDGRGVVTLTCTDVRHKVYTLSTMLTPENTHVSTESPGRFGVIQ